MLTTTIDIDGTVRDEHYSDLESIYAIIGRGCEMFQRLPLLFKGKRIADVFIDEEGKMNGQPLNIVATDLLRETKVIPDCDFIAGKVMVVGLPDNKGDGTDLKKNVSQAIRHFALQYAPYLV